MVILLIRNNLLNTKNSKTQKLKMINQGVILYKELHLLKWKHYAASSKDFYKINKIITINIIKNQSLDFNLIFRL